MRHYILAAVLGLTSLPLMAAGGHYETVYVKVCRHVPVQTETVIVATGRISKDGYEVTQKPKRVFTPKGKHVCTNEPKTLYVRNKK